MSAPSRNGSEHLTRASGLRFIFVAWIKWTAARHAATILLSVLFIYLFGEVHGQWSAMHRWNRATADASLILLAFTMAIGPGARIWTKLRRLLPLRREFGIYSVLLAIAHTFIILDGWVEWDLLRIVGFAFHPVLGRYVMLEHGFGLANLIGVLALAYSFVLMITSNDRSVRLLGGAIWKFLQTGAYVLWAIVVVHTAYFIFIHSLDFHRPLPPANPLRWPFVMLVGFVFVLRFAAVIETWRQRRKTTDGSPLYLGERTVVSSE